MCEEAIGIFSQQIFMAGNKNPNYGWYDFVDHRNTQGRVRSTPILPGEVQWKETLSEVEEKIQVQEGFQIICDRHHQWPAGKNHNKIADN